MRGTLNRLPFNRRTGAFILESNMDKRGKYIRTKEILKKQSMAAKKFRRYNPVSGKNHPAWKGGKYIDAEGYVHVLTPKHPFCDASGYVKEHRLVTEKHLGRYLTRNEYVHHKNGIKNDNRIKNLNIRTTILHTGKIKCPHCRKTFLIR